MKAYYDRRAPGSLFELEVLAAELGDGPVLHAGRWFVAVEA